MVSENSHNIRREREEEFYPMAQDSMNLHAYYPDMMQYWSPTSEKFATGGALLTRLRKGWQISNICYAEEFWHAGTRPVVVYHFDLMRGDETETIPVLNNPYVTRMISMWGMEVRPYEERRAQIARQRRAAGLS